MLAEAASTPLPNVTVLGSGVSPGTAAVAGFVVIALYVLWLVSPRIRDWAKTPPSPPLPIVSKEDIRDIVQTAVKAVMDQLPGVLKLTTDKVHDSTRRIVDQELETLRTVTGSIHQVVAQLQTAVSTLVAGEDREAATLNNIDRGLTHMNQSLNSMERTLAVLDREIENLIRGTKS